MAKNFNYYIEKNHDTNDVIYIEYKMIEGYKMTPKVKKEDAIEVNKIIFVSPTLTEKLIKKKVDVKLRFLLKKMKEIDEDEDDSESGIRETLVTAERLKLNIINNYIKYLGSEYANLSLSKLQVVINELRMRLYTIRDQKYGQLYYQDDIEQNRGRRGR